MLLIDKPVGWTSFDVVAKARKLLNVKRIGHAGTLDPAASGLLIVLVGREETKQQDQFMKLDKVYEVTIKVGEFSTTDDVEGEISSNTYRLPNTSNEFQLQLQQFTGTIQQQPPAYSAIHVAGQRAYQLARRGEVVELPKRTVTIHQLEILEFEPPLVTLRVHCSHGTYIRSLAHDLGGYVTALRRTKIGDYSVEQATSAEQLATAQNQPLIPK